MGYDVHFVFRNEAKILHRPNICSCTSHGVFLHSEALRGNNKDGVKQGKQESKVKFNTWKRFSHHDFLEAYEQWKERYKAFLTG